MAPQLLFAEIWAWVGDQLGKAYSSNDSGDGPESGGTDVPTSAHDEQLCLEAFHDAARGTQWPREWQWDLNSEPKTWRGVKLDDDNRVIGLDLDFGDDEGTRRRWDGKDYGGISAELSRLGRLARLRLVNMGLSGLIPPDLSQLEHLQHLDLSGNVLTGPISAALSQLEKLKHLDLSRNKLTGPIPADLSQLGQLQHLNLKVNRLTGIIPHELTGLKSLQGLDLSYNQLDGLWDLSEDVWERDVLHEDGMLPYGLARFLDWLTALGEYNSFAGVGYELLPNPFRVPPEAVVSGGMEAVKAYFTDLIQDRVIVEHRDVKVVIVGEAGAGKTSLRQSIRERRPKPTKGYKESTVHLDVESVELNDVAVSLYDCAGQDAYYGLLQNFFTERAVYLVVCDMSKFGSPRHGVDDRQLESDIRKLEDLGICGWLRCLSWRVPDCVVILVGTKCDLLSSSVMQGVARRLESACRKWLDDWAGLGKRVKIEPGVSLTSCRGGIGRGKMGAFMGRKDRWLCDRGIGRDGASTKSLLYRITHKSDEDIYRGTAMRIPRAWFIAQCMLDAMAKGRDPVPWVLQQLGSGDVSTGQHEVGDGSESKGVMNMTELSSRWLSVVRFLQDIYSMTIANPGGALKGALDIRGYEGRILRQGSYVFLDVVRLTKVLKPILSHKHFASNNGDIHVDVGGDKPIVLSTGAQKKSWKRLTVQGILDIQLARELWPNGLCEFVLPTLKDIDLAFPLENDDSELVVMLRLPPVLPRIAEETLNHFHRDNYPTLVGSWKLHLGTPPGVIEKVLTRCCRLGSTNIFWRFGVLVKGNLGGEFALVLQYVHPKLELQVHGDLDSLGLWMALAYAISAMLSGMSEFPGLKWEAALVCPKHSEGYLELSDEAHQPGQRLVTKGGCSACSCETNDLGAFAEEILTMVDVRQSRDDILHEMKGRFTTLRRHYHGTRSEDRETAQMESIQGMFQDMMKDMQNTLKSISQQRASTEGPKDAFPTYVRQEQDHDSHSFRTVSANDEAILWQLKHIMESAIEPLSVGQQRLVQICQAIQRQGDESRAVLDFVKYMTKALRAEKFDTPRLACILAPWSFDERRGLSPTEQDPQTWKCKVQEGIEKKKGWFRKEMRVFLVCARTHRLVPCGPDGHGYKIEDVRCWVKNTFGVVKVMVELTSVVLGLSAAAGLVSNLVKAIGEGSKIVNEDLRWLEEHYGARVGNEEHRNIGNRQVIYHDDAVEPLRDRAYESLKEFIHEQEDAALAEMVKEIRKARRKDSTPPDTSWFVFFDDVMEKEQKDEGTGEVNWVLKR